MVVSPRGPIHRLRATFGRTTARLARPGAAGVVFAVFAFFAGLASSRPAWAEPPLPCAARTAELEARYRRADARPDTSGFLPVSTGFEAPTLASGGASPPGAITTMVEVAPSGILVDGRPLDPAPSDRKKIVAALIREVSDGRARWKTLHGGKAAPPAKLGIWLDRRGKAADAVSLLQDLSDKLDLAVLGLAPSEADERDRKEPPASVRKRLDEIRATTDAPQKARLIASARRDALAGCGGSQKMLEALDVTAPDAEVTFHRQVVKTVGSCGCAGVDFDLLEAVTLPAPDSRTVLARPLRLRGGAATRVTLPIEADVQQLVDHLPASGAFTVRWRGGEAGKGAPLDGK